MKNKLIIKKNNTKVTLLDEEDIQDKVEDYAQPKGNYLTSSDVETTEIEIVYDDDSTETLTLLIPK